MCGTGGTLTRARQALAGRLLHSARPAVNCSCRVGEGSGKNGPRFVSTRAKSASGTPNDLWRKAAAKHRKRADVRPGTAGRTDGEGRRDNGKAHLRQRAPIPVSPSTVRKAVPKDSYFAYSVKRDLILSPPWSPVPVGPSSPPQHPTAGPAGLRRARPPPMKDSKDSSGSLGRSEPLAAAPGPGGGAEHLPPPRDDGPRLASGCGGGAEHSERARPRPLGRRGCHGPGRVGPGRVGSACIAGGTGRGDRRGRARSPARRLRR